MALESGLKKKVSELEEQGDVAGLEALKTEAEQVDMDFEVAGSIEDSIGRLKAKVESSSQVTSEEGAVIASLDGNLEEVETRTTDVDNRMKEVSSEAEQNILKLEAQIPEIPNEEETPNPEEINPEDKAKIEADEQRQEKLESTRKELDQQIESLTATLPAKIDKWINSKEYLSLVELNKKRQREAEEITEIYGRTIENHRSINEVSLKDFPDVYADDLKKAGAPEDTVKRVASFREKYFKPAYEAWGKEEAVRESIFNPDRIHLDELTRAKDEEIGSGSTLRFEYQDKYAEIMNSLAGDKYVRHFF